MSTRTFELWRGDENGGRFVSYEAEAHEGTVVLDAVHEIQRTQAKDLAVRWNCKAAKCGSCGAEVNGKPSLMCKTTLEGLPPDHPITVAPLRAFPIIRDLVSDVSWNYEVNKKIPPFSPKAYSSWLMHQDDVNRIEEFRKCIECFLCQDVCHVLRDHHLNQQYYGPRFFVRIASLEMHPLDDADRTELLKEAAGIGLCNITKCCSNVCPEGIHITDNAIIPLKERVVDRYYDPLPALARKVRNALPKRSPRG
jgi:succinate dehydrogenase / fumarate reductase iron-sulfur subunit